MRGQIQRPTWADIDSFWRRLNMGEILPRHAPRAREKPYAELTCGLTVMGVNVVFMMRGHDAPPSPVASWHSNPGNYPAVHLPRFLADRQNRYRTRLPSGAF